LDTYSRKVVGWSIDATQTATLVTNALSMAISNRQPATGTIIHSDHRVQYTSWVFTRRVQQAGLAPSMGSIGDCYDNGRMESFWGRMQTELLNRQRWKTRIELANAIFDYLEIFHNRQRCHSSLGMLSPVEYERVRPMSLPLHETNHNGSRKPGEHQPLRESGGTHKAVEPDPRRDQPWKLRPVARAHADECAFRAHGETCGTSNDRSGLPPVGRSGLWQG
jgi:hypothetical protein